MWVFENFKIYIIVNISFTFYKIDTLIYKTKKLSINEEINNFNSIIRSKWYGKKWYTSRVKIRL